MLSQNDKRDLQFLRAKIKDLAHKQKTLKDVFHMPHLTEAWRAALDAHQKEHGFSSRQENAARLTALLNLRLEILGKEYRHGSLGIHHYYSAHRFAGLYRLELKALPLVEECEPQT